MTRLLKPLLLLSVVFIAACFVQADEQPLKLELAVSETAPLLLTPFYFSVTLTNISSKPIYLGNGDIKTSGCFRRMDYWIFKDGERHYERRIIGDCVAQEPVILYPGEKQVATRTFLAGHPYGEAGNYELQYTYTFSGFPENSPWYGYSKKNNPAFWLGTLKDSITFTVMQPEGTDKKAYEFLFYEKRRYFKGKEGAAALASANKLQQQNSRPAWTINRATGQLLSRGYWEYLELLKMLHRNSVYALIASANPPNYLKKKARPEVLADAANRYGGKYLHYALENLPGRQHANMIDVYDEAMKSTDNPVIKEYYRQQIKYILDNTRETEHGRVIRIPEPPEPPADPIYAEDTPGIIAPLLIKKAEPTYPEPALRMNIKGVVTMIVLINELGNVKDIQVIKEAPLGMTEAAVEAVKQYKYSPATFKDQPVSIYKVVEVKFEIKERLKITID